MATGTETCRYHDVTALILQVQKPNSQNNNKILCFGACQQKKAPTVKTEINRGKLITESILDFRLPLAQKDLLNWKEMVIVLLLN